MNKLSKNNNKINVYYISCYDLLVQMIQVYKNFEITMEENHWDYSRDHQLTVEDKKGLIII